MSASCGKVKEAGRKDQRGGEWSGAGEVCKEQLRQQSEEWRRRSEHGRQSSGADGLAQVRVRV